MGCGSQMCWFVIVGWFSFEKNQVCLFEVFVWVYVEYFDIGLIVVGDGLLCDELEQCCDVLGLGDVVIMIGVFVNFFLVLVVFDCFVFLSDYEG